MKRSKAMSQNVNYFKVLLEQAGLLENPVYQQYEERATVQKVVVDRESRCWIIDIEFDELVTLEWLLPLEQAVKVAFSAITNDVVFNVSAKKALVTPETVRQYWQYVLKRCDLSETLHKLLATQDVQFNDNTVIVTVDSQYSQELISQKYIADIKLGYRQLGFGEMNLVVVLDEEAFAQKQEAFMERQQEEMMSLAHQAQIQLNFAEQKKQKEEKTDEIELVDGIVMGRKINPSEPILQMKDITQEYPSVIFQGYVFAYEERELRNGRMAFTIKFTDYTSSFTVKLFSKNVTDATLFQKYLKKGNWIKVRGVVEEDPFLKTSLFHHVISMSWSIDHVWILLKIIKNEWNYIYIQQ